MGKIICVSNQKGGVGKTTTAFNLGAALAEAGKRILLVDLDPQSSLTISLGIHLHELDYNIYDVLLEKVEGGSLEAIKIRTHVPGVDLIPANINLVQADLDLFSVMNRERVLSDLLKPERMKYDYIVIDCPPSLGLLTINALTAADEVLIPVQSEYLAMKGADLLLGTIQKVRKKLNSHLKMCGILITMHDTRLVNSRDVLENIKRIFHEYTFDTVIKRNVRIKEAPICGKPIISYDSKSTGAQAYLTGHWQRRY
jgi:chromosome partitioning protein